MMEVGKAMEEIKYEELGFGFHTFQKEICAELGQAFWNDLVKNIDLPDMDSECRCQCHNMALFMDRLEKMTDKKNVKKIFCKVRHGLHPAKCSQAHKRFVETGNLDKFLRIMGEEGVKEFTRLNREKKDFYGQEITDEVLEFIRQNPKMLTAERMGNKLYTMAFPNNMKEYISAADEKMKRYHACHCPFAKESILSENVVSSALCNCSLGHVMNCYEEFMGRELTGSVIRSVLNGDLACEYEIVIPNDIMREYVITDGIIASNYFNYYKAFAQSGIIELHEGPVSWIIPRKGEKGPSLAFRIHLDEENAENELKPFIQGIRKGSVPQTWIVTPDATPGNIIDIMEQNGFKNLSVNSDELGMLLRKRDFHPYTEENSPITCRKISTMEDFKSWIEVVNTALHGWNMIDVEHYFTWVRSKNIKVYLAELDGAAVATCATIQNRNTGSLEFVSTLELYRRRKAAALLSSCAIAELINNGAETVTLSAYGDAVHLYKQLGFKGYFHNVILKYQV